ncbi:MAG TPA: tail fiber protein [Pyrinomonadaceae bacterium]|jgi:microcystin-dependent protein
MGNPYIGEIRMFAGSFAPAGWAYCNGAPMPISQNDALFILLGTTYGGDGEETFNLPNISSRIPIHMGQGPGISQNYPLGETGGVESVTLTMQQIPVHNHALLGSTTLATDSNPDTLVVAQTRNYDLYLEDDPSDAMAPMMLAPVGGSQPHENMQPYLCITFILSLYGVFPNPN